MRSSCRGSLVVVLVFWGCDGEEAGASAYTAEGCRIGYAVGECGADFTLPDQRGAYWTLSDQRGGPVVLEFSAVWCPNCQAFAPELEGHALRWREEGGAEVFNILIQDADGSAPTVETVSAWAAEYGLTLPVLADVEETAKEDYRPLRGLPATFVLDGAGEIVFSHTGTGGLVEGVDGVLGVGQGED